MDGLRVVRNRKSAKWAGGRPQGLSIPATVRRSSEGSWVRAGHDINWLFFLLKTVYAGKVFMCTCWWICLCVWAWTCVCIGRPGVDGRCQPCVLGWQVRKTTLGFYTGAGDSNSCLCGGYFISRAISPAPFLEFYRTVAWLIVLSIYIVIVLERPILLRPLDFREIMNCRFLVILKTYKLILHVLFIQFLFCFQQQQDFRIAL